MKIRILGAHMYESKSTRLSSILIDDILAVDAGSLTSTLSFDEQEKIKFIMLTHGHYDHIRDMPAFALKNQNRTTDVFATQSTLDILTTHWINGIVYPKFTEWPQAESPALRLNALEPHKEVNIGRYAALAVPMNHPIPAVGYQITGQDGKSFFFSGDTGPGLTSCWEYIAPHVMIMDMGFSNKSADLPAKPGHLCPSLLADELREFARIKGYLPRVIMTHMNPDVEHQVQKEGALLAEELGIEVNLAYEDMVVEI